MDWLIYLQLIVLVIYIFATNIVFGRAHDKTQDMLEDIRDRLDKETHSGLD